MQGFDSVQTVDVDGRTVAYREAGAGEPVLFVHGWPLCSQTWRKVVPALASDRRCIALDLLGAGETPAPEGAALGIPDQGRMVAGFVEALGLDRLALVGHDSGGSVARAFAIDHSERVSRLVLTNTEVPGHRPLLVPTVLRLASLPGSRRALGAVLGSRRLARLIFRPFFADLRSFDFAEFFDTVVAPNAGSKAALDGAFGFLRAFDFDDVDAAQAGYGRLTMPKLLVWGERDRTFPVSEARRLAEMLPGPVELEAVPGAGLLVHVEAPDAWAERVHKFLAA
jgi:haloalkane dehalogenase